MATILDTFKGRCRTNQDDYKTKEWPTRFVRVPAVGEWVRAKCGAKLRIVSFAYLNFSPDDVMADRFELELNM